MPFSSDEKIGGQLGPSDALFFIPKSLDQNFEIAILFSIVEKFDNYVFENDLITHNLRGKDYTFLSLSIVCIKHLLLGNIQTFSGGIFSGARVGGSGGEGYVG